MSDYLINANSGLEIPGECYKLIIVILGQKFLVDSSSVISIFLSGVVFETRGALLELWHTNCDTIVKGKFD